ncbi:hypothetical protein NPIL_679411 [Nephila pilipes]|uniref:Uncharacterized protein n=1 Tax=Nephila pilipes TaxID=299642 RepID=A0A8X6NMK6_NEPPI|nr:hypothetical protein NPIL_679411 [Nephila pilipes]
MASAGNLSSDFAPSLAFRGGFGESTLRPNSSSKLNHLQSVGSHRSPSGKVCIFKATSRRLPRNEDHCTRIMHWAIGDMHRHFELLFRRTRQHLPEVSTIKLPRQIM